MRTAIFGAVLLLASCASLPAQPAQSIRSVIGPDCQNAPVPEASNATTDQSEAERYEKFGELANLVGKCFKGTPTEDSPEKVEDIQYWAWALGGTAITIEHAFTDGSYGGISYVYPKSGSDAFTYVYITNAGFHTQGTITLSDDQSFTATETVTGHPTITEVRSITTYAEYGITSMTSDFFDDGEWQPGPGFTHEATTEPFPRLGSWQAPAED